MKPIDQNTCPTIRAVHLGQVALQYIHAALAAPATLRAMLAPRPIDPEQELAKAARREAARRAADNLMR